MWSRWLAGCLRKDRQKERPTDPQEDKQTDGTDGLGVWLRFGWLELRAIGFCLGWVECDLVGLAGFGLGLTRRVGLGWAGLGWIGLDGMGLRLSWIVGLEWTGLAWTEVGR